MPQQPATAAAIHAALAYAARGWCVLPLNGKLPAIPKAEGGRGYLDATTDAERITVWWHRWPTANVGIATRASGLLVVDIDDRHGGDATLASLEQEHGALPQTVEAITGSGGRHIYLRAPAPDTIHRKAEALGPGVDAPHYVVAPPSVHPDTGRKYEWEASSRPDEVPLAAAPPWLLMLVQETKPARVANREESGGLIPEGRRNPTLASLAGTMRRKGMTQAAIRAALAAENHARCRPPLPEGEVQAIADSVSRYVPAADTKTTITGATATPWPDKLEEEAFYGITGDIVRAIAPHTEADPAALLVDFLTAAGSAMGTGPHGMVGGDRHGTKLYTVLVGKTSQGRKGSARGYNRNLAEQADPAWAALPLSGLSTGEGLINAVRDKEEKHMPLRGKNGKPTGEYETVLVDSGVSDKRLLVVESEFASVLKHIGRDGNVLSNVLRQAWETDTLRTMTKASPLRATGAHISVIGHITQSELRRYLTETESGNGFANRFLWVCVKRARVLPRGGGAVAFGDLVPRLRNALEQARGLGELERDEEAESAWEAVYPTLTKDTPGLFGAVTARAAPIVLRLSVIYAALDGSQAITLPHLQAAIAVWEYCEASARYIFGDKTGNSDADRIREALLGSEGGMDRTAISAIFKGNYPSARIAEALDLLEQCVYARMEKRDTEGRPQEWWTPTQPS